jgi:hypothetical protein
LLVNPWAYIAISRAHLAMVRESAHGSNQDRIGLDIAAAAAAAIWTQGEESGEAAGRRELSPLGTGRTNNQISPQKFVPCPTTQLPYSEL